jgi:hypothetical protein
MLYTFIAIPLVFILGLRLGSKLTAKSIYQDIKDNYFVEEKVIVKKRHPSSQTEPHFYDQDVEDEFDDIIKRLQ